MPDFVMAEPLMRKFPPRAWITTIPLAMALSSCGADLGGGTFNYPPTVRMEGWTSLDGTACRGFLRNSGNTARDVKVVLIYSTAQGETTLAFPASPSNIQGGSVASFSAPPQVTHGELRFPKVATISWTGDSYLFTEVEGPRFSGLEGWCRTSTDSARASVSNEAGLAYDVAVNVYAGGGVVMQIPLKPSPMGKLWPGPRGCPVGVYDQNACQYTRFFNGPMRDSSGVKYPPTLISLRWEDFAGVPDSIEFAPLTPAPLANCP